MSLEPEYVRVERGDRGNLRIPLVGLSRDVEAYRSILYRRVQQAGSADVEVKLLDPPLPVDPDSFVAQTANFVEAAVAGDPSLLLFPAEKTLLIQKVFRAVLASSHQGGAQVPLS